MNDQVTEQATKNITDKSLAHYYGDTIRGIFILTGVIMLIGFPFFASLIPLPIPTVLFIIILLAVAGGLMNPEQRWVLALNTIVPVIGFAVFEYFAVFAYLHLPPEDVKNIAFFWVNQVLSLLFFFATYLAMKTLRGSFLK